MSPPSLANLSTETLSLIFSHFCLHCCGGYDKPWDSRHPNDRKEQKPNKKSWYSVDRQALVSLSLVSRRLRDIAQNFLYHEFALGYGDSWRSDLYSWDNRLLPFLRTLVQRRDLASLVKHAYIHPRLLSMTRIDLDEARTLLKEAGNVLGVDLPHAWRQRIPQLHIEGRMGRRPYFGAFLADFLDGKGDLDEQSRQDLKKHLNDGAQYARRWLAAEIVAMLIAHLPNLEYLGLDDDDHWPSAGFPTSALTALNVSRLPLKTLDLGVHAELPTFLQLVPGLSTLNFHTWGLEPPIPPLPNLKVLCATEASFDDRTLQLFLSACTGGLHTFAYEAAEYIPLWGFWESDTLPPNYHFRPSDAVRHLESHQTTLRSLHLDLGKQDHRAGIVKPGLNLKDFTVLETLFLYSAEMFDPNASELERLSDSHRLVEFVPASIVSLSVHVHPNCDCKRLEKSLLGLADLKQRDPTQFPNLRWVRSNIKGNSEMLSSMFSTAKVEFGHDVWRPRRPKPCLTRRQLLRRPDETDPDLDL